MRALKYILPSGVILALLLASWTGLDSMRRHLNSEALFSHSRKRALRFILTDEREVLMLSEGEVSSLISMGEAISAVERAFRNKYSKKVQMPPKPYLFFDKAGRI